MTITKIALFKGKKVRKIIHNNEWWFVIVDVIEALTDSVDPRGYIKDMRRRDEALGKGWGQIATPLLIETVGGKQSLNCANTENVFRLIQSIPSPKAEPFKRWLARVGYERVQEIEDPELATKRTVAIYKAKGYPESWIDKRMRGIAIRQELTNEWEERGVRKQEDYSILTAEISKAAFGMTPNEYRKYKNINKEVKANLRDSMTDLELIFTMLGEKVTTEISKKEKPKNMPEHKKVAKRGGGVAGRARNETEKEIGRSVVSKDNFLDIREKKKLS